MLSNCFGADKQPEEGLLVKVVDTWALVAGFLVQNGLKVGFFTIYILRKVNGVDRRGVPTLTAIAANRGLRSETLNKVENSRRISCQRSSSPGLMCMKIIRRYS